MARPDVSHEALGACPGGGRRVRVLVVDDCRDNADTLAVMIRCWGHDVAVAYDGTSALELARAYRPDLAFIDIGMPGIAGTQLAEQLVRQSAGRLAVAAVSGFADAEHRQEWAEHGLGEYLVKPAAPAAIKRLLDAAARAA